MNMAPCASPIMHLYNIVAILNMSERSEDAERVTERVLKHNEKFNVPIQTEREEAEVFEDAKPQNLADESEIKRKKEGLE